jgi:hypothetical protein
MMTRQHLISLIEEKWIQDARKDMKKRGTEGAFSASAKRAGMDTCTYARKIMSGDISGNKKRANFALNTGCKGKG